MDLPAGSTGYKTTLLGVIRKTKYAVLRLEADCIIYVILFFFKKFHLNMAHQYSKNDSCLSHPSLVIVLIILTFWSNIATLYTMYYLQSCDGPSVLQSTMLTSFLLSQVRLGSVAIFIILYV